MVWPLTCVVPEKRIEQDEKADMTRSRSIRKTPTTTKACALPFAKFAMPLTAVLTTDLPLSMACSMPDFVEETVLDAAFCPPAVWAAVSPE